MLAVAGLSPVVGAQKGPPGYKGVKSFYVWVSCKRGAADNPMTDEPPKPESTGQANPSLDHVQLGSCCPLFFYPFD